MSWIVLYFVVSVAFTVGWIFAATFARRRPDRDDLCGRADCVYCQPHERRQPDVPSYVELRGPGGVVLRPARVPGRVTGASRN